MSVVFRGLIGGVILVLSLSPLWAAEPYLLRDAVEFAVRGGCPNLFAKLKEGKPVNVAYLGGSITAQNGWRPKTLAWFREQFTNAPIEQINAAIGGTGSDLGAYRLRQDVLQHKPDLLFVEFAVNDGGADPKRIHKSMEGIVRQTWKADPCIDICYVYTLTVGMLEDLQGGKYPRAASAMEALADHYAIPSIHMGLSVARLEKEGKVVFKEDRPKEERLAAMERGTYYFSKDGVHPYADTGHILYLQAVVRAMTEIGKAGKPGPHALGEPFDAGNWEDAGMVPFSKAKLSAGWRKLAPTVDRMAKRFSNRMAEMWLADKPGETATFKFRGSDVRIYDLLGPSCGKILVTVDGKPQTPRDRFDAYSTYHRLATMRVAEGLAPDAVHTVKLEISEETPDKRKHLERRAGPNAKVLALGEEEFAKRFAGREWYAGMLLLRGELVE